MNAFDASWHLLGLFLPALTTAAIAASAAKLLWRAELRRIGWLRLLVWTAAAGSLALLGGLLLLGRDGRIASYGTMVVAAALVLWWATRPAAGQRPRSE
jgi:hypothetical protein